MIKFIGDKAGNDVVIQRVYGAREGNIEDLAMDVSGLVKRVRGQSRENGSKGQAGQRTRWG